MVHLAVANGLFFPNDVAVDAAGNSSVSEFGERIWVDAPNGNPLRNFTLRSRAFPEGLGIDPTSGNWVDAYSIAGEPQCTCAMTPGALESPYSGFSFGVTYSGPNQLFVTDRATHQVARLKIIRQRCSDCGQ